jgi:hypothetical protein
MSALPVLNTPEDLNKMLLNSKVQIERGFLPRFAIGGVCVENLTHSLLARPVQKRWGMAQKTLETWVEAVNLLNDRVNEAQRSQSFKFRSENMYAQLSFQIRTVLTRFRSVLDIYRYWEKNKEPILKYLKHYETLYLRPRYTGLCRAIHFNQRGELFVHLNKLKKEDELLGDGTNKIVKKAYRLGHPHPYATAGCKYVSNREIEFLNLFRGVPGFLQLVDVCSYDKKVRMVFEFCNLGNLQSHLSEKLERPLQKQIFEQLIQNVALIHQRGLLHRDLKPANILLHQPDEGPLQVVIADFGAMCWQKDEQARKQPLSTLQYASPSYAKAVCSKTSEQDLLAATTVHLDGWGLGCILFQLLKMGKFPWGNSTPEKLQENPPPKEGSPEALVLELLKGNLTVEKATLQLPLLKW